MEILRNLAIDGPKKRPILADVFFVMDGFNKPVVLFNHGFKGFKDWGIWDLVAKGFAQAGFVFVKFNQRHNGTTPRNPTTFSDLEAFGKNTISRELDDLHTMHQWLIANSILPIDLINTSQMALMGHSRGGSTAILAATRSANWQALITWSAFKDFEERYKGPAYQDWEKNKVVYIPNVRTGQQLPQYYVLYQDFERHRNDYHLATACTRLVVPHLIVHGTEDPTVLFNDAIQLKTWNKKAELYLVPHANHVFGGEHPYTQPQLPTHAELAVNRSIAFLIKELNIQSNNKK